MVAFRCYQRPGLVSYTKCTREQKGCSFQPGWMPKEKAKSKGKAKSEKLGEKEPSRPSKKRKVEVLVPEWSVGESIVQNKHK